jgi:hypothetical protein
MLSEQEILLARAIAPDNGDDSAALIAMLDPEQMEGQTAIAARMLKSGQGIAEIEAAMPGFLGRLAKVDPEAKPIDLSAVPPLPSYAQLTQENRAEAQGAGAWLDDYIAFASQASPLTPRVFHIAAGLHLGAMAIARRLCIRVSSASNTIYPNLYLLFVGQSTRPRKSTAMRVERGLLSAAGMDHFLLASRQTPEALTLDMTLQVPPSYTSWPSSAQADWLAERPICAQRGWLLDEASHLLDSFNRDFTAGLLPLVLDMYDCADEGPSRNTVSRGRERITKPYLSLFGATTYGALRDHLQKDTLWHNGLWARFALIGDDGRGEWQFWPDPLDYPQPLVRRLRFIAQELLSLPKASIEECENEQAEVKREVTLSGELTARSVEIAPDAWKQWELYSKATGWDMLSEDSAIPTKFQANYGRLGTMLIKVAAILATFDAERLPVRIEARHAYRAQTIVEQWRTNLHNLAGELAKVKDDDREAQIKNILASAGNEWTTRRTLLRTTGLRVAEIEPALQELVEAGDIESRPTNVDGPGRKSEEYRLCLT